MQLVKVQLFQTGTYNQMQRRSYVTSVDGAAIQQLNELTHGGQNLSRAAIAPVASQIVTASSSPIGQAIINGGWDNARCRILMEFEQTSFNGAKMRKVVTGYTDHLGINPGTNSIDPNMCIHINQIVDLMDSVVPTSYGSAIQTAVRGCDQILFGNYDRHGRLPNDYMIRPGDIFNNSNSQMALMNYAREGQFADLRSTFVNGAVRSRRDNLNPTAYTHRLLRAAAAARLTEDDNGPDTLQSVNDQAAGIANDAPMSGDTVLRELNNRFDLNKRGFITWRDLISYYPHVMAPGFIKVNLFGGVHARRQLHASGASEYWNGDNVETVIATMLGNALPGILTENMIYRIGLYISNVGIGGTPEVVITTPPQSMVSGDVPFEYLERMKSMIITELMPGLTANGWRKIAIHVNADVMDEISIGVSVEHQPVIDYVIPSFADNTFSLVTTNSLDQVYGIVADITNLTNNLGHAPSAFEPAARIYTGAQAQPQMHGGQPPAVNRPTGGNRWRTQ